MKKNTVTYVNTVHEGDIQLLKAENKIRQITYDKILERVKKLGQEA